MPEQNWLSAVLQVLMSVFGALARLLNTKHGKGMSLSDVLSDLFVAGFAGLILFWISKSSNIESGWIFALSGICGWIGPRVLDAITQMVTDKVGIKIDKETEKDEAKTEQEGD